MTLQISTQPYALPLLHPWPAKTGPARQCRKGWIIRLFDAELEGYGDCAPLPRMGTENREQAETALKLLCRQKYASTPSLQEALNLFQLSHPCVFHAVETALLDFQARQRHQALAHYLYPQAQKTVAVNFLGGSICHPLPEIPNQDHALIKFKIGAREPALELQCLQRYCAQLPPNVQIRLDANGQWTLSQARIFLDAVQYLPIESLEEPVSGGEPRQIETLQASCRFPLALDESLARLDLQQVICNSNIHRLVLKPMLLGGLKRSFTIAQQALATGKEVIITSGAESAIGVWSCVHLAAAVEGLAAKPMRHGLSTCQWLAQDTAHPPGIKNGAIHLPSATGLGITP